MQSCQETRHLRELKMLNLLLCPQVLLPLAHFTCLKAICCDYLQVLRRHSEGMSQDVSSSQTSSHTCKTPRLLSRTRVF